jgi:uncharacterized protein YndB with AHSA1/START domain
MTQTHANAASMTDTADAPVRKTIDVSARPERAFQIFTQEIDTWWPRTHHIGKSPMRRAVIEGHAGGRCYTEQEDGTDCDWGSVLAWDPPRRFVMGWQITAEWTFEPNPAKASEVEVTFTSLANGGTRVDLEHRFFARHGVGGAPMRASVDAPNGWTGLLVLFAERANATATEVTP